MRIHNHCLEITIFVSVRKNQLPFQTAKMQLNQSNCQSYNFPTCSNATFVFFPFFWVCWCCHQRAEPICRGDPSIKKAEIFESLALNCIAAARRKRFEWFLAWQMGRSWHTCCFPAFFCKSKGDGGKVYLLRWGRDQYLSSFYWKTWRTHIM